jgi:hypothetical protein
VVLNLKTLAFVGLVLWGAASWWRDRPVQRGPVAGEPVQVDASGLPARTVGAYTVQPFARFEVRARVLSTTTYRMGREADLAPVDLALGWNRMSESAVLERLSITQSGRWYHYRWGAEGPPIPPDEIVRSSANMHLIPASPSVQRALDALRVGERVQLKGQLVDVSAADGWRWKSSRSRTDSGGGACELVWVESVTVLPPV